MSKKQVYPKTTEQETALMEKLLQEGHLSYKFAIQVRAVLRRAQKQQPGMIAEILYIMPTTVSQYVNRFNKEGIKGLISNKAHTHGKAATRKSSD